MSTPAATSDSAGGSEAGIPPVLEAKTRGWRWLWAIPAGLLLAALGVLYFYNPAHHSFYPFCTFYRVTGWQCPGCGGLRAAHHLVHGEMWTAFRFNPLVVLMLPMAIWLVARRILRRPQPEKFSARAQARWAWIALAVLALFWIVRNLPFEMFRLPAE